MSEQRYVTIPLDAADGQWATLTASWPITEEQWQRLLFILGVMKPALVVSAPPADERTARPIAEVE